VNPVNVQVNMKAQRQVHLAPIAGTAADDSDMKRMGTAQELNVWNGKWP
jgi:hypothetical protein